MHFCMVVTSMVFDDMMAVLLVGMGFDDDDDDDDLYRFLVGFVWFINLTC